MAFKIKDGVQVGTVNVFNNAGALLVNAPTATALAAARTIAISGAVTGTATSFDGSTNITISATALAAGNLSGTIPSAVLGASSVFIGSTSVALNRASAAQTLTGISIDGNAGTATTLATARTIAISGAVTGTATSFNGGANITISATALAAGNLSGTIPGAVLGASSVFIGTTSIALNRATGALALTGVSIDGNAGTVTNGVVTTGSYADPAWITSLAKSKVGLANVENTALSTWAGSSNITTIGAATAASLVVTGNLTVNGTTTTVNSTTVTLDDPIITLGGDTAPASDDGKDRGVEYRWHNGTAAKVGFFGFDRSTGKFTFIPDATNTGEVFSGTKGVIDASIEWADILNKPSVGTGSVTSVAMTVPTGLTVSGSPITTSGTLAVTLTSGYAIPTTASQTNWDTAFSERNRWDGGASGLTAATGRTSLGATTVGGNLFTLTNPGAVTFLRVNADNSVSTLDAATFRTAIGAGTSSTVGTVTSVGGTGTVAGLTLTGTVTASGNLTLGGTLSTPVTSINDSTVVGRNLVKLANPSAITFLRVNADNTVSTLDAATFRTAIGAQVSGSYLTAEVDTLATVTGRGATTGTAITLTNATNATSGSTGALVITGGLAVNANVYAKGSYLNANSAGTVINVRDAVQAVVAATALTAVDTWPIASYRSAKYLVQITQGTNYQFSEIVVVHNGTTTTMTEYAVIETNGALGTFTADVSAGNARLLVTMGSATSATINIERVAMVV
jgi:hypothetical protein